MNKEEFNLLSEDEKKRVQKERSKKRLFTTFLILDIALIIYLVYSLVRLFTNLG